MNNSPIEAPMFCIFTGNRFNQVLIFPTYEAAADWCRKATRYTETEIVRAIKTPRWNGGNHLDLFDV